MKPFKTIVEKYPQKLGLHYAVVPDEIAKQFKGKHPIRMRAEINKESTQCALVKRNDGSYIIYLNITIRKKLKINLNDTIFVSLKKDDSEFGLDLPEELEVLLEQDPEGKEKFLELNPGTQRNIIYYISLGKLEETRIQRSVMMIDRAKNGYWIPKRKK